MPAITQELAIGIGFHKQTGTGTAAATKAQLQTALDAASLWSLNMNAFNMPAPVFNNEDDSEFYGKGDEFARTMFPTSIDAPWEWPFHLTSQNFAQVICFALPNIVKSAAGAGFKYVCTPQDRVTQGVNLPATTLASGIRQGGAGEMWDMALIGVVCTGFTLRIQRGPGLQNTSLTSRWVGCGKFDDQSGIAIPALTNEIRLGSGGGTKLMLGSVDYLANAKFIDLEFTYENGFNGESGYFLGSGQQNGYDIRGRMRVGRRTQTLVWSAEWESDNTEMVQIINGTEGQCELEITGPVIGAGPDTHLAALKWARTRHKTLTFQESDGFVAARVETTIMKDAVAPWVEATAVTDKDEIGSDPPVIP